LFMNKAAPAVCWPDTVCEKNGSRRFNRPGAGGLGTPKVLQDSGVHCDASLFVDPVLCVAAEMENCRQNRELPMPFAVQKKAIYLALL